MAESPVESARSILVAGGDEGSLAPLSAWLGREGYQVLLAGDGEEALQKAVAHLPDLIFLDIQIPKLDGYSLLLRLKGNDRTHEIPVFICSGQSEREQKELSRTFGAVEFIEKPLRIADVACKVADALA